MEHIKNHFDEEAKIYDDLILKLIPYYNQMLEALITAIPFNTDDMINVIDLGCGTGTISKLVKERFPKARITCVDIAENMIETARYKLADYSDIDYIVRDFYAFDFPGNYDVAVSSLALHHLVTPEDKVSFYKKIYTALNSGGCFFNADVVLASTNGLQNKYMEKWHAFMRKSVSQEEIDTKWIPTYNNEDRPEKAVDQLKWLVEMGFTDADIIWKYYNFAVYGAYK